MKKKSVKDATKGDIWAVWMDVARLMRRRMIGSMSKEQINPLQVFGLIVINDHEGLTMKEFAQYLHVSSPSATSLADRLARVRWIVRKTDAKNRKLVRLHLSKLGKRVMTTKMNGHMDAIHGVFQLMNEKDRTDLFRILHNLHKALLKAEAA